MDGQQSFLLSGRRDFSRTVMKNGARGKENGERKKEKGKHTTETRTGAITSIN